MSAALPSLLANSSRLGLPETCQRGGHIPGARSVPSAKAANDDGTFKAYDELMQIYGSEGIDAVRPVIAYCRIGERSSHTWFVLKYLLGYDNVRNYDGSWTEWGNLVGAAVEYGPSAKLGADMKVQEFAERSFTLAGWDVRITTYKLGNVYHCKADNVSPAASLARTTGETREAAEQKAIERASQMLSKTRVHPV